MTQTAPLAYRMRPQKLEDFVGQEQVVGEGTALRNAIERGELRSVILAGPPGTGKTTLAHIISQAVNAQFVQLNAVMSGVKDLREVCSQAEQLFTSLKQRTVLFVDEIHRFNKSQQDALLPYVESGVVILIGATTENPYFEVNAALVSRSHVCLLLPHSTESVLRILQKSLEDERGYGGSVQISGEALKHIAKVSNGDARIALNSLELAVLTVGKKLSIEDAQKILQQRALRYDSTGEEHYNTISAFIKSLRGSDADAALLWMYKMLRSGEEARFLFRRMLIFASEDIGNADPRALMFVTSAWQAFELVGLPEGEFFLAHACIYLAQAPKSNAVTNAMHAADAALQSAPSLEVPNHIRNAPVKGMKTHGIGVGYQYPHSSDEGVVQGHYFPVGMTPQDFYQPTNRGFEQEIRARMERAKRIIREAEVVQG